MKRILLVLGAMALVGAVRADDVWVLQGSAQSSLEGNLLLYLYTSDVLLYNTNQSPARIRVIEVSNGPLLTTDRELILEPAHSTSIARAKKEWHPDSTAPLWVTHLDVPAGVIVESRISVGQLCTVCGNMPNPGIFGKLSFPVMRTLQTPLVPKIHVGTDLHAVPARNNVAVYNDGAVTAHAHIEVHQLCDEAIIDTRDIEIPAKSVLQTNNLLAVPANCTTAGTGAEYTYVTVTVDQPSVSWVSSLSNADRIKVVWAATSSSP
jgi:hypothetical protein